MAENKDYTYLIYAVAGLGIAFLIISPILGEFIKKEEVEIKGVEIS